MRLATSDIRGCFFVMRNAWKNIGCLLAALWVGLLVCGPLAAQESVCARVKIEIKEELTLERQAFDAEMRIANSLAASGFMRTMIFRWGTDLI